MIVIKFGHGAVQRWPAETVEQVVEAAGLQEGMDDVTMSFERAEWQSFDPSTSADVDRTRQDRDLL